MKKLQSTFLLLIIGLIASAQNISVADFYLVENDLTARLLGTSVEDQNGYQCALIKVETTEKGLWTFDVGMLGVTKTEMQNANHSAEIWVYVPFSVTWISIQHDKFGKMDRYKFPCSIDKGCTYIMKLTTGKVRTNLDWKIGERYLQDRMQTGGTRNHNGLKGDYERDERRDHHVAFYLASLSQGVGKPFPRCSHSVAIL